MSERMYHYLSRKSCGLILKAHIKNVIHDNVSKSEIKRKENFRKKEIGVPLIKHEKITFWASNVIHYVT